MLMRKHVSCPSYKVYDMVEVQTIACLGMHQLYWYSHHPPLPQPPISIGIFRHAPAHLSLPAKSLGLGLPLGLEAPVMTPNSVCLLFLPNPSCWMYAWDALAG